MKRFCIFCITAIFFLGCVKEHPVCCPMPMETYLKARLIYTSDINCHLPVLDFSEDSAKIRNLTREKGLLYNVVSLPEMYKTKERKLFVKVAVREQFACITLGISYTALQFVDGMNRD